MSTLSADVAATIRASVRESIARAILDYGESHHEPHDPRFGCQRCDITAAYRHAAKIARGES